MSGNIGPNVRSHSNNHTYLKRRTLTQFHWLFHSSPKSISVSMSCHWFVQPLPCFNGWGEWCLAHWKRNLHHFNFLRINKQHSRMVEGKELFGKNLPPSWGFLRNPRKHVTSCLAHKNWAFHTQWKAWHYTTPCKRSEGPSFTWA